MYKRQMYKKSVPFKRDTRAEETRQPTTTSTHVVVPAALQREVSVFAKYMTLNSTSSGSAQAALGK